MEVAHISDVHVPWPPGEAGPWYTFLNKRLVGGLNLLLHRSHPVALMEALVADLRAHPPDHLVLTGDLSNLALEAEFSRVRTYLEEIGLPPERVSVIPGNHDAYVGSVTRKRLFEQALGELAGGAQVRWPRAQRREDVLFVSTSSAVPTPWFTAYGRMGRAQLEAVTELLAASDAAYKVVLVHHPPVQGDGRPDRLWRRNLDGAGLLAACRDGGAQLILCGHTHRHFRWVDPGAPSLRVICGGSSTSPRHGAAYHRYRIEGGALRSIERRAYDAEAGAFVSRDREDLEGVHTSSPAESPGAGS